MWPNTTFRGRGRGNFTSIAPDQYPSTSYVQTTAGSRRGGQIFNYQHQNRGKWGRARPQQNQTYFHGYGVNSNQMLPPSGRGAGGVLPPRGRGGGLIDSAATSPFVAPPPFASHRSFGPQLNEPGRARYDLTLQDQRSDSAISHTSTRSVWVENRPRRDMDEGVPWPGQYSCPKCDSGYQLQYIHNKYGGKLPLVLQCGHTMCQECIYQGLKNNKINCAKCHIDSSLTQEQTPVCQADLYNVFRPNYHILGVISFHRGGERGLRNLDSIGFVTRGSKKPSQSVINLSETCCFSSCTKPATMYCPSCDGTYCSDCSIVVHKSAKNLMSHQPVPKRINKFTLALENCNQHPSMPVEFICKTCDLSACCYCVLNQHSDHDRAGLYQLNPAEMEEFSTLQKNVEPILKHVLTAQKKASKLANFDTAPLKKQVCNYFSHYHGQLQTVESKLLEELDQFKANNRGLDAVQTSLKSSAELLKQLIALDLDRIGDKKLNLRAALVELRKLREIPIFLLNDAGQSYPIRFVPDECILTELPQRISLQKCEGSEYRLVKEEELPEGYVIEDESDEEVDLKISAILDQPELQPSTNYSSTGSSRKSKTSRVRKSTAKKKPGMDRVDLQHVNSMDSFYVHLKKDQAQLVQLSKDIENYVKMGGAEAVAEPELNGMYLVLYSNKTQNKGEQMWCRARLHNLQTQGEETLYDMFFIDYGKTQLVNKNRIRDIPPSLCQKKPFALECTLHNPMNVNWNEKAHHSLARILNGKDVFMLQKSFNQGIYEVDLMIASSDGGMTSVIDILVHAYQVVDPIDDNKSLTSKQTNYGSRLMVFPNSKTFDKNQKEKVVIANIVDPHNIFVHMVQHQEAFKSMCNAIKRTFKNSKNAACIPIEGTYVLVEYKDPVRSNFHRAFIKSVDIVNDKVYVLLVDWGLNVVVSMSNVRPLEESLTKLESQAVLVKLAHVAPYNQKAVWSRVSNDFLQVYFKSQDVLKMMVHNAGRELEVALFDCSRNVDVCINALMVEHNYADSTGFISTKLNWPQFEPNNPEFNQEDGLMSALLKKVIEDTNDDSDDDDDDDTTDVKKRRIDVIKVESPSLIWIKFLDLRDKERELNNGLQAHYSAEAKTKSEWEVGELCVVELKEKFCRGTVQEVQDGQCKIFFIDKIVEETVPFDKMFEYAPYFTQYPQIAYKCHLANIRPSGDTGNWSISSIEALQELCAKNYRLYAGITTEHASSDSKKKTMPIYMWYGLMIRGGALEPDRIKYISINNSLAKLGFAYNVPAPKIKKAFTGDDLLNSLVKKPNDIPEQENLSCEENKAAVPEAEASGPAASAEKLAEKTQNVDERLVSSKSSASGIDAIQNLSLEDQPASDEKKSDKTPNWNDSILSESDDHNDKEQVEVTLEDWLPPLRLLNTEFEARVTCIETGGHLYLHDKSVHQGYENMEKNMKQFFESEPPEWIAHAWEPGHLCTIKYTDGNWYRGKVLKVVSPQCITVFMIDFGSDHILPATALYRQLLYTNIPAFATKVKLAKVYARSGTWLTSDYDYFQSLVSNWCRIVVQGPKEVELPLVEVYNVEEENVNKKLIELCPNLSRCAVFPVKGYEEEESDDSIVIEAIEPVELNLASIVDATKYEILPLPQDLLEGKQLLMEIGGVFDFKKIAVRSTLSDESEVLSRMITEIQDLVFNLPPLTDFQVGTPCLAPFSEDEIYYRAKIIEADSVKSDLVHVLFVDYGNHESVPISEVKTIPLRYLQLPQQCWEADLNIEPANEDSDLTSITEFVKHLERRKRRIKLVKEDPITVDIYNKNHKLCYAQYVEEGSIRILHQDV